MSNISYIFDVDGTLTLPRQKIDDDFREFFECWCVGKKVYLLTGSDSDKTIEQIGYDLWASKLFEGIYQSCGNELYRHGKLVKASDWHASFGLLSDIYKEVERSPYHKRFGNHVEIRTGMINFSTVGRNASGKDRLDYYEWDGIMKERTQIVSKLQKKHVDVEFSIGGQISVDVYPIGKDKSQVLEDIKGRIYFFGDKCSPGGNDWSIASKLKTRGNRSYEVSGPDEIREILENLDEDKKAD